MYTLKYFAILPFISSLFVLVLGLFVYSKNRKAEINQVLGFLCMAIFVWLAYTSFCYASLNEEQALMWARSSYFGVVFIPVGTYHFVVVLLDHKTGRKFVRAFYLFGLALLSMSQSPYFFKDVKKFFWGFYPQADFLYNLYPVFYFFGYMTALYLLFSALKSGDLHPRQFQQIKYVFISFLIAFCAGVDYLGIYGFEVYPVGYICMVFYTIALAYAIIKHSLMDVEVAVTRTGIFIITYLFVLGVPVALSIWGQGFLKKYLQEQWWVVPVGLNTALASFGPFILTNLWRRTEEALQVKLALREKEATTDMLTGMLNRRAFAYKADSLIKRARETAHPCTLLMVDLDYFKEKNDTYGHQVGDAVLKETARRLSATLRSEDLVGRYGGEEFVLILSNAGKSLSKTIAERLRKYVIAKPIEAGGHSIEQTISIGVSVFPDDAGDLGELIEKADQALYTAKNSGRNKVEIARV